MGRQKALQFDYRTAGGSELPHTAPLFDGFFPDSNLRAEPFPRFAEGEIQPNHIHEGHQEPNPEAVAVNPFVTVKPRTVFPGDAKVTEKGGWPLSFLTVHTMPLL